MGHDACTSSSSTTRARAVAWLALGALAVAASASAEVRITNTRFFSICRVVVTVSNHNRSRVVHDGSLPRGRPISVNVGGYQAVCAQRSIDPEDCKSGLTRSQCKIDEARNRTIIMNLK